MKREIKFRVWHNSLQEMLYDFTLPQAGSGQSLNKAFSMLYMPIMQFTGLKDKNGKDIYEGDILRYPIADSWEKTNYSCYEVFFHDGDANLDYNIGYSISRMHNHGSICGGVIPAFKPHNTSEMIVIGNIYENPEFLK